MAVLLKSQKKSHMDAVARQRRKLLTSNMPKCMRNEFPTPLVLWIEEYTVACFDVIFEYELLLLSTFRAGAVLENGPSELLILFITTTACNMHFLCQNPNTIYCNIHRNGFSAWHRMVNEFNFYCEILSQL